VLGRRHAAPATFAHPTATPQLNFAIYLLALVEATRLQEHARVKYVQLDRTDPSWTTKVLVRLVAQEHIPQQVNIL